MEKPFNIPFLVSGVCNSCYSVEGLKDAHENISKFHTINDPAQSDYCLLGVDYLQYLTMNELIPYLGGVAPRSKSGVITFANADNQLSDNQLEQKYPPAQTFQRIE